jgi:acyl-[acyl-carrier-protein] desaturase
VVISDLQLHPAALSPPLLRYWDVFELTDLPPEAEQARQDLAAVLAELDTRVSRLLSRREKVASVGSGS